MADAQKKKAGKKKADPKDSAPDPQAAAADVGGEARDPSEAPDAADAEVIAEDTPQTAEPLPGDESASSPADESTPEDSSSDDDHAADTEEAAAGDAIDDTPVDEELSTEQVVEAVLFATESPLPLSKIVNILGIGTARDVRNHIKTLNQRYEETGASFRIEEIAGGFLMLTLPVYNNWLRRLKKSRQESKLSQAAMETLAVVAYKQPVVRADVEAIRGVAAGEMLNRLRELGLVKIVGRAEDVGRPLLYGTTKRFLEVFALSSLEELPEIEELQPPE